MSSSKTTRRTRPVPERTGPDRAWTRSARRTGTPPPGSGAATPQSESAANGAVPPTPNGSAKASSAGPAPNGAASPNGSGASNGTRASAFRTLNDAYRLVDEYMRQGQEMAANAWMPFTGNGAPSWPVPGAPERFLRAMGDMTLAWIEAMQTFTNPQPAAARPPSGTAGPFASAAPSPAPSGTPSAGATPAPPATSQVAKQRELAVSVQAKGRVEVSAAFNELATSAELEVGELRPAKGKAAPLRDVTLSAEAERIVVRVVVPDGQPRGTYNALVLDAKTQKPQGTLSVVVE